MIKTALKHFLYEQCINIMFDNIGKNFKDDSVKDLFDGRKFRKLTLIYNSYCYVFYDGIIVSYQNYVLHFNYTAKSQIELTSNELVNTTEHGYREATAQYVMCYFTYEIE